MSRFGLAIVAIDRYEQAERLPSTRNAARLQALLEPFGAQVTQASPESKAEELRSFLYEWATDKQGPANSFIYWIGHGGREGLDAWLLATNSRSPFAGPVAVNASDVADMLRMRWTERTAGERAWTVLVLDCCRGRDAANVIVNTLTADLGSRPGRLAIVEVGGASATEVGRFIDALEEVLTEYIENDKAIPLRSLLFGATDLLGDGVEPTIWLPGNAVITNAGAVPGVLTVGQDVVAEWRRAVASLDDDVRTHFLAKAQGTEMSDLAWNFVGRQDESAELAAWLRESGSGLKVVTGEPGAGKSALLGRFVMLADARIVDALGKAGHLTGEAGLHRPDVDAFQCVTLLTGKTLGQAQAALAGAGFTVRRRGAGDPPPTTGEAHPHPPVRTVVVDALDEAQAPELIAHDLLRPLSRQPGVRVVVATRRSLAEGPDLPESPRHELLDALGVSQGETIFVRPEPEAMAGFARGRLVAGGIDPEITSHVVDRVRNLKQPFLFVRLAVHELLARAGSVDVATADEILGGSHGDIFGMSLDRLRSEERVVTDLLAALAYTQGRGLPLHDQVWTTVAGALWPGRRFVTADAKRALVVAAPYIVLDGEHGQSVYRLAHKTFTERFLNADPDVAGSHLAIAESLLAGSDGGRWVDANAYVLAHLPRHAAPSGPTLDRVTTDPGWLGATIERFGVNDLLQNLEGVGYAQRTEATTRVLGALRRARVALTRDPDQLAAQLHARLRDEIDPAVATLVRRLDEIAPPVWLRIREGGGTWKASTDATMTFSGKVRALTSGRVQGRPVLAVAAADRVQWWDPLGGELHDFVANEGERVTSLAMGVIEGQDVLVVGATYDGTVTVRPFDDGEPLALITGIHFTHVGIGTLHGQTVVVTAEGSDLHPFLLDGSPLPTLDAGGEVLALGRMGSSIVCLVEHPDGVKVCAWMEWQERRELLLPGARRGVTGSLVEIDGSSIAVLAQRDRIDAWEVITGNHLGHVDADPDFAIRTATALPVGTDIALAAGNDTDYEGGYVVLRTPGAERSVGRAQMLAGAVAVATDRMQALLTDPLRVIDLHRGDERPVSMDDFDVAGTFGPNAPATSQELQSIPTADPEGDWPVSAWSFGSLDGERVIARASLEGACWLSSVRNGATVAGPFGPGQTPGAPLVGRSRMRGAKGGPRLSRDVAFCSSGGDAFIACVHDGGLSVYDVRSGATLDGGGTGLEAVGSEASAVVIGEHPSFGLVLARGAGGGAISLWTVPGGRRLCGLSLDQGINRLWFDRQALRLVAQTSDREVHVADIVGST